MKINSKEAELYYERHRHPEENDKKEDYDTDADADYEAKRTEDLLWDKW
jgi:hypothetical protein